MRRNPILPLFFFALALPALASAQGRLYTLDETVALIGEAAGAQGSFRWDPFLQEGSFAARGHHGVFSAALFPGESGFLMLNNRDVHNVPLPFFQGGSLVFPAAFVETAQDAFARLARGNDSFHYRIAAIIIDPGHGGRDPGAVFNHVINGVSRQVRESDITLRASIMLRDALRRSFPDKLVLTTRERDVYLSLADRTAIANSVPTRDDEGIIFISIHANYATNRSARGFEVWHLPPNYTRGLEMVNEDEFPDPDLRRILNMLTEDWFHAESTMIAQSILSGLQASVGSRMPNRGLRAENWFVVSRSNMPAVLVELGFISNAQDAAMLTNDAELRRIVDGVHGGIVNFVEAFERSGGFLIAQ